MRDESLKTMHVLDAKIICTILIKVIFFVVLRFKKVNYKVVRDIGESDTFLLFSS
jgi:hypothetical protein